MFLVALSYPYHHHYHNPSRVNTQSDWLSENTTPFVPQVPLPVLGISEIQSRVLEEVHSLTFVKENSATFIERKLSFEKKKPAQILVSLARSLAVKTSSLCLVQIVAHGSLYCPHHANYTLLILLFLPFTL